VDIFSSITLLWLFWIVTRGADVVTPVADHRSSVPNGGYTVSCILRATREHFETTLARQDQPHTLAIHAEFPRRTEIGPATIKFEEIKLGRQLSTVHATFIQHGSKEILAYITQTNLSKESGLSFETGWTLSPAPYPTSSVAALANGTDPHWAENDSMPFPEFRKASHRVRFFFPRRGQMEKGWSDHWITFRNPAERFTQDTLGYVCDMFPQVVEAMITDDDPYHVTTTAGERQPIARFWYPTVVLNIDVKKALPEEGIEWLFVRCRSKQIKNGRYDIEVIVMDEHGELVAISHHVAMVLSAARNLGGKKKNGAGDSKI